MGGLEVWVQRTLDPFSGIQQESQEKRGNYYLVPKGTIIWPRKKGRFSDHYRGSLVEPVLVEPVTTKSGKSQKSKRGMLVWRLNGGFEESLNSSLVVKREGATLCLDRQYWQIRPGTIIGTGSKKDNLIKKI